ncbi:hypothetical protein FEM48_Zijuj09G0053100 [Ziziphus jujuba var. spinosa]|uniref:Cytochrome P450 94A1-like n=1 Tax=Ziziphus jujuba var. spinosa TaxID=714518 RepID=A0A978UR40_ZIZJJ|nr:hypothetical protein FEM48_Zijuj09G0053100 [Ziziphus jujuba var. spinosa]
MQYSFPNMLPQMSLYFCQFIFYLLIFLFIVLAKSFIFRTPSSSPPSTKIVPKSYPLVGHFFAMYPNQHRRTQFTAEVLRSSPSFTFVFRGLFGRRKIMTANPAVVQHILKTNFPIYQKGDAFRVPLSDLLGDGIFNAEGDSWKFQRQVSVQEFTTKSLRNFVESVVDIELTDRLLPILSLSAIDKSILDFQDILQRFAFDNICKIAFGYDPACLLPSLPYSKF